MAKIYRYSAINKLGKEIKGTISADSEKLARKKLKEDDFTPIEIVSLSYQRIGEDASFKKIDKPIGLQDLSIFTRELSSLLNAGLEIEQSIYSLSNQIEDPQFKQIIESIHGRIMEGYSFSAGLNDYPHAFPIVYRATLKAAEEAGKLGVVLSHLADYLDKQLHMRQKILQALIYPSILTLVGISIVIFLLSYVVPAIITVFEGSQKELPFVTVLLIKLSTFIKIYGIYLLIALIGLFFVLRKFWRYENVREVGQKFFLKIPVMGTLLRLINTERFLRTLGILIQANVPILQAIEMSSQPITMIPIKKAILLAKDKVKDGATLRYALSQTLYFTPSSLQFIASGEATGHLDKMLELAAINQQRNVNFALDSFLALFEPILILVMGCVVMFIVLAILLPMFELSTLVG